MTKEEFDSTVIRPGICIICQRPFQLKRKNQICCSDTCREILSAWRKKESNYFYNNKYDKLESFSEFIEKKRESMERRDRYRFSQMTLFPKEEGG